MRREVESVILWSPHLAMGVDTLKCYPSWLIITKSRTTCIGHNESDSADSQSAVSFSGVSYPPIA